jgi:hypothetical protein
VRVWGRAPSHLAQCVGCVVSVHAARGAFDVALSPPCAPPSQQRSTGEQRLINLKCRATIGAVSNPQNKNRVLAKAGASRWAGFRPTVRRGGGGGGGGGARPAAGGARGRGPPYGGRAARAGGDRLPGRADCCRHAALHRVL